MRHVTQPPREVRRDVHRAHRLVALFTTEIDATVLLVAGDGRGTNRLCKLELDDELLAHLTSDRVGDAVAMSKVPTPHEEEAEP